MSVRHQTTEKQMEAACDRAVRAVHGEIVLVGRGRVDGTQSPGIPSRRYYVHGHVLWWAPRAHRGRLSGAAIEFCQVEHSYGQIVGAGTDTELRHVMRELANGADVELARALAWSYAKTVIARSMCAH